MNSMMHTTSITFLVLAFFQVCSSFLTLKSLRKRPDLLRCYEDTVENHLTTFNGQVLPLPSSIETFVSLMERYESKYPDMSATILISKLFKAFRVGGVPADLRNWGSDSTLFNTFEKIFFNIPENVGFEFKAEDFTDDEICALHLMLSHGLNYTSLVNSNDDPKKDGVTQRPRENGVVSLQAKWKHAFALDKVLLGILAGLSGNNLKDASSICLKPKCDIEEIFPTVTVNRLTAVTLGGVVSAYVRKWHSPNMPDFKPNGIWNDASCTTHYTLDSSNEDKEMYTTNSLIRGAVDGLIIGRKLESKPQFFKKIRLSQILRMYYGSTGVVDDADLKTGVRSETHWCNRDRLFQYSQLTDDIRNFYKVYVTSRDSVPLENENALEKINSVISIIQTSPSIFTMITEEMSHECSGISETNSDKKYTTPFQIFAILDMATMQSQRDYQIHVLGNLSVSFDIRPKGNSFGVYTNTRAQLSTDGLNVIANNTGISGCPACFFHYKEIRSTSKMSEIEVFEKLNQTLTKFVENEDHNEETFNEVKAGSPSKVILYFNYQNSISDDEKLKSAVREIKNSFRETTILAIGSKKESLKLFTENPAADVFTESTNAAEFAPKLMARISKVPAEFHFKECNRSSSSTEAANKQSGFIAVNKKQYWAMYPKYFLKSFNIKLKFRATDGSKIRVCYSRLYFRIMEENSIKNECQESSGDEIVFNSYNPCHRRTEYNCDPFYFSVEGKQAPNSACASLRCSSPKDIQFEFQHEGISCNTAYFISISTLAVVIAVVSFIIQRS